MMYRASQPRLPVPDYVGDLRDTALVKLDAVALALQYLEHAATKPVLGIERPHGQTEVKFSAEDDRTGREQAVVPGYAERGDYRG